jgi:MoaA/NifB/PqqE/SkfB family radical SAM enzyme
MQYDVEADWTLNFNCNFRCSYCFFPSETGRRKDAPAHSPQQWQRAFHATGLVWLVHITGGEPALFPGFAELCARLSQHHYLSLNSNLSGSAIGDFAKTVDPGRVSFINASFHPFERQVRNGFTTFFQNAARLRERGFKVMVSVVATPAVLAEMAALTRQLAPLGLVPVPKLLRGRFDGRKFPEAYSEDDRQRFRCAAAQARDAYAPMLAEMAERPSIDPFFDERYLDGIPSFHGLRCAGGRRHFKVGPDGEVVGCNGTSFGNLLEESFARSPESAICSGYSCHHWCDKYIER